MNANCKRRIGRPIVVVTFVLLGAVSPVATAQSFRGPVTGKTPAAGVVSMLSLPTSPITPQKHTIVPIGAGPLSQPSGRQRVQPLPHPASQELDKSKAAAPKRSTTKSIQADNLTASFQGIGDTGPEPPDPVVAVGPTYVLEAVNTYIWIMYKDGSYVYGNDLRNFFGNFNDTFSDPKVVFDQYSQRYLILILAFNTSTYTSSYMIGVSETSDPTGLWYKYSSNAMYDGNTDDSLYADYPGLGFDPNWSSPNLCVKS